VGVFENKADDFSAVLVQIDGQSWLKQQIDLHLTLPTGNYAIVKLHWH